MNYSKISNSSFFCCKRARTFLSAFFLKRVPEGDEKVVGSQWSVAFAHLAVEAVGMRPLSVNGSFAALRMTGGRRRQRGFSGL